MSFTPGSGAGSRDGHAVSEKSRADTAARLEERARNELAERFIGARIRVGTARPDRPRGGIGPSNIGPSTPSGKIKAGKTERQAQGGTGGDAAVEVWGKSGRELAKNFTSSYFSAVHSAKLGVPWEFSMPPKPPQPDGKRTQISQAGEFMGVGIQFAASIVFFLLVGRWLDLQLGTTPWLLILGVFIGAAAGFFVMYRQLVIVPRERQKREREQK